MHPHNLVLKNAMSVVFIMLTNTFIFVLIKYAISPQTITLTKDYLKTIQTSLFALAFVSIGLETDFSVLVKSGNGQPAIAFLIAQVFNILLH